MQDLREGKVTYPFFFAYKNANRHEKKELELLLGKKKLNQKKCLSIINRLKGIEETEKLALKYIDIATSSAMNIDR